MASFLRQQSARTVAPLRQAAGHRISAAAFGTAPRSIRFEKNQSGHGSSNSILSRSFRQSKGLTRPDQRQYSSGRGRDFPTIIQELSQGLLSMKKPAEYIITLTYCIAVLAPIRICIETGIFRNLAAAAEQGKTLTAAELAATLPVTDGTQPTEASDLERRDFVVRTLRAMRGIGLIDEPEPFVYGGNALTATFADPTMAAGYEMCYDMSFGPKSSMVEMGRFMRSNNYRHPPSAQDGPVQRAWDIVGTSTFQHYVDKDPLQLSRLSMFMSRVQKDRQHWTEWFPAEVLFGSAPADPDRTFFVDVAGGFGHDLFALTAKYPEEKRNFVLQDLPSVITEGKEKRDEAKEKLDDRIQLSEHNFFEPQPVKPASIYYMHKIIHDWPDSDCVRILSHLRDAMGPDSRIFINDMIIPDKDCPILPAAFDITMLALHSGQERDEDMWKRLIDKVDGLQIKKFWHPPGQGEGIVEIVKA